MITLFIYKFQFSRNIFIYENKFVDTIISIIIITSKRNHTFTRNIFINENKFVDNIISKIIITSKRNHTFTPYKSKITKQKEQGNRHSKSRAKN